MSTYAETLRDPAVRALRFLFVSDPGNLRLRNASATTLSLVLALVLLATMTHFLNEPITVAMLGTVVAMFASFVVKDRTTRGKVVTTALLPIPAIAAVTLSSLLSPHGKIADVAFIVVLFMAVYVRKYGPRGFALGMTSFISYFFALFLKATPAQIPILALSVVIGVAASLAVRAAFLHEKPGAELRRLTRSLRASCVSVIEDITPVHEPKHLAVHEPKRQPGRDMDEVRRGLEKLANTALMIEDWLDRNEASSHLSVTGADLSRRIFDAQQATEQLVFALSSFELASQWPPNLGRAMVAVAATLQNSPSEQDLEAARLLVNRAVASSENAHQPVDKAAIAIHYAQRTVQAHNALHRVETHAMDEVPAEPEAKPAVDADDSPQGTSTNWIERLEPTTRAAMQVAVATSAATILGELISPARWYWAVLSAFVVFTGTTTRGEILTRAGHRVAGTVAGVVAGVLLSAVVGQRPVLQLILIVVCVFCAFYLVTVANSLLVFFVTVLLAMLYGLLGTFSIQVLELRIEETLAGATVGIVSAYFILPIRTRATLIQKVDDYLDQLDALVESSVESVLHPGSGVDLVPAARNLDTALQAITTAAKPLGFGPTSRARHGTARLVRVLAACDRAARSLAKAAIVAAAADPDTTPSAETAAGVRAGTETVRRSVLALREVVRGNSDEYDDSIADSDPAGAFVLGDHARGSGATRAAVRALNRIEHAAALTRVPS